jgi:SsrA-binding protein
MSIVKNTIALFERFIEHRYKTGLDLQGWDVTVFRAGRTHRKEAHVRLMRLQADVVGVTFGPLGSASAQITPDSTRPRRCRSHRDRIDKLICNLNERDDPQVPFNLRFSKGQAKRQIGLAKDKSEHDRCATITGRDGQRDAQSAMNKASRDEDGRRVIC